MRINYASLPSTAQEGDWLQKNPWGIWEKLETENCAHNQISSAEPYQWALEGCSLRSQLQEMSFED